MHDGRKVFDPKTAMGGQTWSPDRALAHLGGRVQPTIVVGIDNTALRTREYTPRGAWARLSPELRKRLADRTGGEPLSDEYLAFIVSELKPFIDKRHRTRPDATHTAIMGSSMGRLISLYALARYPGVVRGAAGLSIHRPVAVESALLASPDSANERSCSSASRGVRQPRCYARWRVVVYADRDEPGTIGLEKALAHLEANGRQLVIKALPNHKDWNLAWRASFGIPHRTAASSWK